jgi:hypothetical protein
MFRRFANNLAFIVVATVAPISAAAERHWDFSSDPGWDGYRNRLLPDPLPRTTQNFGYRQSNHAGGKSPGEIGGFVQRSLTPASYAKAIPAKTLNDKLSASGRFAVTNDESASGVLFGWFHESSRGWRTPNSLVVRLDGNGRKYWLFFEYGTSNWLTGGGATFEGRYQTTKTKPFPADGTPHEFSLTYDPAGHNGDGEITLVLDGKNYSAAMLPGHKADGALFNRFGILNVQTSGSGMEVYLDDLVIDGVSEDFSKDPQWIGIGNQVEFAERAIRPRHDFGYSRTKHAGGSAGEIGGLIWRDEFPSYYGGQTDPLTLTNELQASGTLAFTGAGSDSAVYFGWFNAQSKTNQPNSYVEPHRNFLGILIEGRSRIGHYFRPGYGTASGAGMTEESGPIIKPDGRVHRWSIRYRPEGGEIIVRFDENEQRMALKPEHKALGAVFNRFGFFNVQAGGHYVELFIDDLTYTAAP